MKASRALWYFLLAHMIGTWTHLGGKQPFHRHERALRRFRPVAEPVLAALFLAHLWQGGRSVWRFGPMHRFVSGSALVLFLGYHLKTLRFRRHGTLYDATRDETIHHWYLYEAGLIALAAHLKHPWIPLGMALVPAVNVVTNTMFAGSRP